MSNLTKDLPPAAQATPLGADASTSSTPRSREVIAVALVLALFWLFLMSSVRDKSLTSDETAHAVAGYTYWKYNDYRLNPENGNLPQRVMALPLWWSDVQPPPRDHPAWRISDEWEMGDVWFHQLGNDLAAMLFRGRAAIAAVTVVLGALIWLWSRQLFGPFGGAVSLGVFVLNPSVLANGALMTSDATCALFFLASVFTFWRTLQHVTVGRLVVSGLVMGAMFVSKMSAVLLLPIAAVLLLARLRAGPQRPLVVGASVREVRARQPQALVLAGVAAAHVILVPVVIWACYGFRFAAFAPGADATERFQHPWEYVLEKPDPLSHLVALDLSQQQRSQVDAITVRYDLGHEARRAAEEIKATVLRPEQIQRFDQLLQTPPRAFAARAFDFLREAKLLPEAYIYGYAHAWRFSRMRSAFFNGEYGVTGWKAFFPYTFLVKTPLPVFGVIALAAVAAIMGWKRKVTMGGSTFGRELRSACDATLPLWLLLAVYWAAVIPSRLNIGHRHILATYPPLFVLCGAAGSWLEAWWRNRGGETSVALKPALTPWAAATVSLLLAATAAEVAYRYPHYLAYFNGLVRPANAYRHLVDSSLDWGQDLPGLKRYLDGHAPAGPVYLSYFGTARPESYGIQAKYLYSAAGLDQPRTPVRELHTTKAKLDADLADARREWPDCELVARADFNAENIAMVFLQRPAVPQLTGGTYCISATMLQAVFFGLDGPLGHWNHRYEARYQELRQAIRPLLDADAKRRSEAFVRRSPDDWTRLFEAFAQFRFARLTAFLRQREPDDQVGYSILIYQLSDADVAAALDGPPPELGPDLPTLLAQREQP